jgi:hypothetical protein
MKQTNKPWMDRPAAMIATCFLKCQQYFCRLLQRFFAKLSTRQQVAVTVTFILLAFTACTLIIFRSLSASANREHTMMVQPIQRIHHRAIEHTTPVVTEETMHAVKRYRNYMDSIKREIPKGIADSLQMLEHIYQSQK